MEGTKKKNQRLQEITTAADGSLTYTGDTFRPVIDGSDSRRIRTALAAGLAVLTAVVMSSGLINAAGASDAFYVILPYIGEVSSLFVLGWNIIRQISGGDSVRRYVLEHSTPRIQGASRLLTVFAAAGLVLSVVYIARNGFGGQPAKSILYPVLKAVSAAASGMYRKYYFRIGWE